MKAIGSAIWILLFLFFAVAGCDSPQPTAELPRPVEGNGQQVCVHSGYAVVKVDVLPLTELVGGGNGVEVPAVKVYVATAMPGFDERLIPGRTGRYEDRQNGELYRTRLEEVMASNPNWVEAYTWNEWWENTHIEPSVNYGDLYLQITGEYLKPWLEE